MFTVRSTELREGEPQPLSNSPALIACAVAGDEMLRRGPRAFRACRPRTRAWVIGRGRGRGR
eukprot:scaffold3865_cov61-Phaeocystis_antarctica.AAC.6